MSTTTFAAFRYSGRMSEYATHLLEVTDEQLEELQSLKQQDGEIDVFEMPSWIDDVSSFCPDGRFRTGAYFDDRAVIEPVVSLEGADIESLAENPPDDICELCWNAARKRVEKADDIITPSSIQQSFSDEPAPEELTGVPGTRFRWKPKGYARDVWWDIVVPDVARAIDLQQAISSSLGLDDGIYAWEFADKSRPSSRSATTEVKMPEAAHRDDYSAAEVTGADLFEIYPLTEGDKLYYLYDLSMPVVTYGIVKERVEDCGVYLSERDFERQVGSVFVLRGKWKRPSRY